jgi:hypothetical protein
MSNQFVGRYGKLVGVISCKLAVELLRKLAGKR